jgi:hypothetical protein
MLAALSSARGRGCGSIASRIEDVSDILGVIVPSC